VTEILSKGDLKEAAHLYAAMHRLDNQKLIIAQRFPDTEWNIN
jgi:hypothetical protein